MKRDGRQKHQSNDEARPKAADPAANDPRLDRANDERAEKGPNDAALAAPDRCPADEDGGQGDQQETGALGRKEVLVFHGEHNARQSPEHAHQREQLDLLAPDVNANHPGHVRVIAYEQQVLPELVAVQNEPHQHGQCDNPEKLHRHRADSAGQDVVHGVLFDGTDIVTEPAGGNDRRSLPNEQGRQRRYDRWNADAYDEKPVDEPDEAAGGERRQEGAPQQEVMFVGQVGIERKDAELRNHHERQAGYLEHGGEGEVDLPGGDDEGQAKAENERRRDRAGKGRVHAIPEEALGRKNHEGADHDHERGDDRQAFESRPKRLVALDLKLRHVRARSANR